MTPHTHTTRRLLSILEARHVACPECGATTLEVARGRLGPIYQCSSTACAYWWAPRSDENTPPSPER